MRAVFNQDRLDGVALLILRFGLAWFIFVWAVNKILTPGQYQQLVRHFDGVEIATSQVIMVAAVQVALCLMVFAGIGRLFSYSALLLMHFFTVTRRWEQFLAPFEINGNGFPVNRNVVIDLAVLGAMIALVLLIRRDHLSLGGWLARRRGKWAFWM